MTKTNRGFTLCIRCILCAVLPTSLAAAAVTAPAQYNVRDFGASGNGRAKDTAAIQAAIDACAKSGGGTVYLPAGRYLTGAVQLRSHIAFEVGPGAVILGSEDPADYPLRDNAWGGARKSISSLIYAADVEDLTITVRGTIDGRGQVWWKRQWLAASRLSAGSCGARRLAVLAEPPERRLQARLPAPQRGKLQNKMVAVSCTGIRL